MAGDDANALGWDAKVLRKQLYETIVRRVTTRLFTH